MDGAVGGRVGADVREQVVDELAQPVAVSEDDSLVGVELDRPERFDGPDGLDCLADDLAEVHRLALERPPLVQR